MTNRNYLAFCVYTKFSTLPEISTNALLIRHADLKENGYVVWLDNVLPSSVCDVWFQYAPLYFTNQLSDDEYLDKLNAALYESIP